MYYQSSINSESYSCTREKFLEICQSASVANTCKEIAEISMQMKNLAQDSKEWRELHDKKGALKRRLPSFLFSVSSIDESTKNVFGTPRTGTWRNKAHIHLNGLAMIDIDGCDPKATINDILPKAAALPWKIVLAHATPSAQGLRLVITCKEDLNLWENVAAFCSEVNVTPDESCKDPSRLSFAVPFEYIYILSDDLFIFNNRKYEERFGNVYRTNNVSSHNDTNSSRTAVRTLRDRANSQSGTGDNVSDQGKASASAPQAELIIPKNEAGEYAYRGIAYSVICDALLKQLGGTPQVGEREVRYFTLVSRYMRYICDNNEEFVLRVTPSFDLSEDERRHAIKTALDSRRYGMSKKMRAILEGVGVKFDENERQDHFIYDNKKVYQQFAPFFTGAWAKILSSFPDDVKLGGMLAAGAMMGTYLSPVTLRNFYDGTSLRLSYMVYIIGQAASGKGAFVRLNDQIMGPLRMEDDQYRKMEEDFKTEMTRRETSRKEQNKEALNVPMFPIRYLPGTISNAMRYRRMKNAKMVYNGDTINLHCYIFESELSAKLRSEQGSWAGAQDLDCKSFANEYGGNDYANSQATNGPVQVNMNQVITGTQDALNRKITQSNCLDGLPTRMIMFQMPSSQYKMIERRNKRKIEDQTEFFSSLVTTLEKFRGDFDLDKTVDVPHDYQPLFGKKTSINDILYKWGVEEAERCREEDDKCSDYFRRRAPVIAARYAAVDAILRSLDKIDCTAPTIPADKTPITWDSVLLAWKMASYVQESQMYFFGNLVNAAQRETEMGFSQVTKSKGVNLKRFAQLPDLFTIDDVAKHYASKISAHQAIYRWTSENMITHLKKFGKVYYKKNN